MRIDLTGVLMQLRAMNVDDIVHFDFIDPPAPESMMRALENVLALGLFEADLTMRLSIEPALAKMSLAAGRLGCASEAVKIIALLQADNVFITPTDSIEKAEANAARSSINTSHSDHLTLLRVFNDYIRLPSATAQRQWCQEKFVKQRALSEAVKVRQQLAAQARALDITMNSETAVVPVEKIRKAFAIGHATQVARRSGSIGLRYVTKEGTTATISKNSALYPKRPSPTWVIYDSVFHARDVELSQCTPVTEAWLREASPQYFALPKCQAGPETPLTRETCLGYAALCNLGWEEGLGPGSFNQGETALTTPEYRSSSDKSGIGHDQFAVDATLALDNTAALGVSGLTIDPPKATTSEVLGLKVPPLLVVSAPVAPAPVAKASPPPAALEVSGVTLVTPPKAITLEVLGLQVPSPSVVPAPHTSAPAATASPASAPLATTAVATTPVVTTPAAPVAPIADLTPAQYTPLQVQLREEFVRVLDKVDDADRLLVNLDEECERVCRGLSADRQVLATRDRPETLPPPSLESD
ncbi:putative ATP-dependent RNA helicase dhx33 [Geranomyces variabilis]|nr:putative ATP-dependent RNA helicase dhx33 [Geranomyces variabilis]